MMKGSISVGVLAWVTLAASWSLAFYQEAPTDAVALPESRLARVRGADPDKPKGNPIYCESQNLEDGDVQASDCAMADTVCVKCDGDRVRSFMLNPGGGGSGFNQADTISCGGKKLTGTCQQDPVSLKWVCMTDPWDEETYCTGEVRQGLEQDLGGP